MSSINKLGPFIQKLMATVVESGEDDFVKQLAWDELKRLNVDIEEFLRKNKEDDSNKIKDTVEKQLLQESKNNGNN